MENMKKYTAVFFFAALFSACTAVEPESPVRGSGTQDGMQLPGNMRVVDYSVGNDAMTKAYPEGLDASDRISSLIYLLYDNMGNLVSERIIPGIGPGTVWPLKRENMSWEQREALKDTLEAGRTYVAVFAANADPALFGLDGTSDSQTVLHYKSSVSGTSRLYGPDGTGASVYEYAGLGDVYLTLPPEPFGSGNMFYLDVRPMDLTESEDPYICNIYLQRIVSRTDIKRISPDTDFYGNGPGGETEAETNRRNLLGPLAESDLYPGLRAEIKESIKDILSDISGELALKSELSGTLFLTYAAALITDAAAEAVLADISGDVVEYLTEGCVEDSRLRTGLQSWAGAEVQLSLTDRTPYFIIDDTYDSSLPSGAAGSASASGLPAYVADDEGTVSVIGFGDGISNVLSSMSFSWSSEADMTAFSIKGLTGFALWPGKNAMNTAVCEPVSSISFTDRNYKNQVVFNCDLRALLDGLDGWDDAYLPYLNAIITDRGYGNSYSDAALPIDIPHVAGNLDFTSSVTVPSPAE